MSGPWEKYAAPAADGPWAKFAPPKPEEERTWRQEIAQGAGNLAAGAVRGAGSIGATILYPYDKARDLFDRASGVSDVGLSGLITGQKRLSRNEQRRADMDAALQSMGAEPDAMLYKGGKLAGEIAGTAGAGGAVANLLGRAGALSPAALEAIRTAGMSAQGAGLPTRALGGAVTGGVSAGMANPDDALTGAAIGAALPGATKLAGMAGRKIGEMWRGPQQAADLAEAVRKAQTAGYVIPPTQANASLPNRMLEGLAGKISTAQNASAKNQAVSNSMAAKALGLPADTKLTTDVLDDVRREAGKAYRELADLPPMPAVRANSLTNTPGAPAISPAKMVYDLREARNDATAWFRSYERTAAPDALAKAKAAKAEATRLETALEDYAKSLGKDDLVAEMVKARQLIAKTYSVENALNAASGTVDARKLAKQLDKGKPLSGELKSIAEFAARFPKAAQAMEGMGSLPQTSPLDWAAAGGLSMAMQNPLGLLSLAARPAARSAALSPMVQQRLLQPGPTAGLLSDPGLLQLGYRAAPLLGADQ